MQTINSVQCRIASDHPGRGRKPLPFAKLIAGKILGHFGSREIILHKLSRGGFNGVELLGLMGIHSSRERISQLFEQLGIFLRRVRHQKVWNTMRFLRKHAGQLSERSKQRLAQNLTRKRWVREHLRLSGVSAVIGRHTFPRSHLVHCFYIIGIQLPRKRQERVALICGYCGKKFSRLACYERALKKGRKHKEPFCCEGHSGKFVATHYLVPARRLFKK